MSEFSLDLKKTTLLIRDDQVDYIEWVKSNYRKSKSQQVRDLIDDKMNNDKVYQDVLRLGD